MDKLESYLEDVTANMIATWPSYKKLEAKKKRVQPIPFFGDIKNACILTVGVNPSASEFKGLRWPAEISLIDLKDRLTKYFVSEQAKPDDWFDTWIEALKPLEALYQSGSAHLAAHVDLSPRVTASMGGANRDTFLAMMKEDARWFFELLPECKATRLMLFAGSVTGRYYMDEFVECVAYRYGYRLEEPPTPRGKGFGFNRLLGPGVDLPIFFSSLSPSSPKLGQRQELIDRVKDNREKLLEYIK